MINIRYNTANPAIASFNAGQQVDDARRAREEVSFRQQFQDERQAGVDRAIRTGFGRMQQPAAPAAPAPAVQPAPAAVPASVSPPAQPIGIDSEVAGNVGDIAGPPAAAAQPAPAAPAAPAIAAVTAQPRSRYQPVMEELSRTPGGGTALMQMDQLSQQEAQRQAQAERQKQMAEIAAIRAMHNAEPDIAAAIAQKYGVNIPPEFIKNKRSQQEMAELGGLIKQMGVTDDNAALQITRNYLEARKGGGDHRAAMQGAFAGVQAAPKAGAAPRVMMHQNSGRIFEAPTAQFPNGRWISEETIPRQFNPNSGAAGGGGSKQQQFAQWRIDTLVQSGMPLAQAQSIVAGRGNPVTNRDVASLAARLMRATDDNYNKLYPTMQDAMKAARDALGTPGAAPQSGGSGGAQAPYPEGTRLRGKDGATYTVKGGVPVKD